MDETARKWKQKLWLGMPLCNRITKYKIAAFSRLALQPECGN